MTRFANHLMNSPVNSTNQYRSPVLWAALAMALVAYFLPWLSNPEISLTLGAYDLAEWVSLSLPERPLTTMLFLRLPSVCLLLIAALDIRRRSFALLLIGATAVALLPPFEFIAQRDDLNYRQQFLLALAVLSGGAISVSGVLWRFKRLLIVILALIGAGVSVVGLSQAMNLMQGYRLPTNFGIGGVLFVFAVLVVAITQLEGRS